MIRKAVFPCAGLGTRFLPATKAQPKEMLPVFDRPAIQYVVEEALSAGLKEMIIVTGRGKQAIENHFDKSFELEHFLKEKNKTELLKNVERISDLADIHYVRQKEPLGLGHAILCAKTFVGDEPFTVFLADDIIYSKKPAIYDLIEVYNKFNSSVLYVEKVPKENIPSYGIIKYKSIGKNIYEVIDVVEKPGIKEAPSNLGIVGRYVFTPQIFEAIESTSKGKLGEIQVTDAIKLLIKSGKKFYAVGLNGKRYDTGTYLGYIQASIEYALRNKKIEPELKNYLKSLK